MRFNKSQGGSQCGHRFIFIAFIGLQNANIVVGGAALLELFSVEGYNLANGVNASFNNVGITVLLAIIGVIITSVLVIKDIKGNILWGYSGDMASRHPYVSSRGFTCQIRGLDFYDLLPDFSDGISIPGLAPVFFKTGLFQCIFLLTFLFVVFAFFICRYF